MAKRVRKSSGCWNTKKLFPGLSPQNKDFYRSELTGDARYLKLNWIAMSMGTILKIFLSFIFE